MIILMVAAACVAAGVGTGVVVSKRRFNNNLADAETDTTSEIPYSEPIREELDRYEQLRRNLSEVKENVSNLEIPLPEAITSMDDAESSLNKISKFFEKNSKSLAGTEAFIMNILPSSQIGESLSSLNSVLENMPNISGDAISALKDGATLPSMEDMMHISSDFWSEFAKGMSQTHAHSIGGALAGGFKEVTGVNDALGSIKDSFHSIGTNMVEGINVDGLTDLTDFDPSGHIPVITIAVSSFRELNLLLDDKTDAMTSLKNIGLDAAGAGGGGLVGAKAGAIAGSFFGPLGTVVGGIIGGIGGAMGGRAISNEIKQKPLKNAIEEYQSKVSIMKSETKTRSKKMLGNIHDYTLQKRQDFKNDNILKEIPVSSDDDVAAGIALVLYQAVVDHLESMKMKVNKLRSSFWYSDEKYGIIVQNYEQRISVLEQQLPIAENVETNPKVALESLFALNFPDQKKDPVYEQKFKECSMELKEMNDKNNSSLLVWSYMVNGLYQKTMNEIANYANDQMKSFNQFIANWKNRLSSLENNVNIEKGKLGLK